MEGWEDGRRKANALEEFGSSGETAVQCTDLLPGPLYSDFDYVRGMGWDMGFLRLANSKACCRLDEVSFLPGGLVWMDGRGRGSSWSGYLDAIV